MLRREALAANLKRYSTGTPCVRGHIAERLCSNGTCCECLKENKRAAYAANPTAVGEKAKRWRANNPEKYKAAASALYQRTKELVVQRAAQWALDNQEKIAAQRKAWRQRNSGRVNAWTAKRRAALANRTPPWISQKDIEGFYMMAARVSRCLGIPHEVDHIEPLQGIDVSGLHVPWNLRVIPASHNRKKCNKRIVTAALDARTVTP